MSIFKRSRFSYQLLGAVLVAAPMGFCAALSMNAPESERTFLQLNDAAMNSMMKGMAIHASGNVDDDFAAMMIPHHQGAIDMARAELQFGTNEQLRRIAQEIIVDQNQEIAAMRLAVKPVAADSTSSR